MQVSTDTHDESHQANSEKSWVAFTSLMAAVLLTSTKLGIGLWTGSLGILAEAAHSALDLVAAAVTLWAVRISSRPADREHTYGHGKFENLSALFETLLLLVTCIWIIWEGFERLFVMSEVSIDLNFWAFAVVIGSIIVDISRSRALKRAADKYQSQALEADALHFSTDVWSSCVVLFGLSMVVIAENCHIPWLMKADSIAALGVAGIVIWVSLQLGKKSVDDLLDSVPAGLHEQVDAAVRNVAGVLEVKQIRLRRSGAETFADITLSVGRDAAFEQAHAITDEVESVVQAILPKADVVVHAEPVAADAEALTTTVRMLAARRSLGAHAIRIIEDKDERWLELHLEVDETLTLDEAHRQASEFEAELRATVPELERIVTHLEPAGDFSALVQGEPADVESVKRILVRFQNETQALFDPHDVQLKNAGGELSLSLHCVLRGDVPITDAHDFSVQLENYLKKHVKRLGRVVIHVEPKDA